MQSTIFLEKRLSFPRAVATIALACCLVACAKKKLPPGVMTQEAFAGVLIEVYIAEAKLGPLRIPKDSATVLFNPWEENFLAKKAVSKKSLKATYRYYLDHPSDFENVYEIVTDTLNLREQRALHEKKVVKK